MLKVRPNGSRSEKQASEGQPFLAAGIVQVEKGAPLVVGPVKSEEEEDGASLDLAGKPGPCLLEGANIDEARQHAETLIKARGLTYINGFDDPAIIAGQGTMGIEILRELGFRNLIDVQGGMAEWKAQGLPTTRS